MKHGSLSKIESALESRARWAAERAGLRAVKSRWRRNTLENYGEFRVIDPSTNFPVFGFQYDATAEEVIEFIKEEQE